jgi:hypothetical protein
VERKAAALVEQERVRVVAAEARAVLEEELQGSRTNLERTNKVLAELRRENEV